MIDPMILRQALAQKMQGMGGGQPQMPAQQQMPMAAELEIEKQKIKDSLKRVREEELHGEVSEMYKKRTLDIESEQHKLFSGKK